MKIKNILSWPKRFITEKLIGGWLRKAFSSLPVLKSLDGWKTEVSILVFVLIKVMEFGLCCGKTVTPYIQMVLEQFSQVAGLDMAAIQTLSVSAIVLSILDHFAKKDEDRKPSEPVVVNAEKGAVTVGMVFIALILTVVIVNVAKAQDDFSEVGSFDVWNDGTLENRFTSHRESERHYDACLLYAFQQVAEYGEAQAGGQAALCDDIGDWSPVGGFLWKPESDNTGLPVILAPIEYIDAEVELFTRNFVSLGRAPFRTIANGNRAHWDAPQADLFSRAPIYVRFELGFTRICKVLPDPSQRYD